MSSITNSLQTAHHRKLSITWYTTFGEAIPKFPRRWQVAMHLEWVPDEYAVKTHYISEWDGLPEIISQINQACRHAIKAGLQIVIEVRTPKDSHIINAAHATVEEDDETA